MNSTLKSTKKELEEIRDWSKTLIEDLEQRKEEKPFQPYLLMCELRIKQCRVFILELNKRINAYTASVENRTIPD